MDWIDILIRAAGQLPDWLTDTVDIVIKATGQFYGWLTDSVDILLKATPGLGGLSPMMVMLGGFLVLVMGWQMMHEKEE